MNQKIEGVEYFKHYQMNLSTEKLYIVTGVANHRSIAAHTLMALASQKVPLLMTYQSEKLKSWALEIATQCGLSEEHLIELDVSSDASLNKFQNEIKNYLDKNKLKGVGYLFHSIAFAQKEDLEGSFLKTSRENFLKALDISCYSLLALTQALESVFCEEASIVAMTYVGSTLMVPHYNVMGVAKAALESSVRYLAYDLGHTEKRIRVNALSAGPIKTLAAMGIKGFREMLDKFDEKSILKTQLNQDSVAAMALYLASDLSKNTSGEVIFVDNGFHLNAF